jgi:AmiR/NasT family two-component response regulator
MEKNSEIRILIAEDDFLVSEMIEGALLDRGYTIAGKAANGRQALELVQSLTPDVVLMDIEMPDMGGIEASQLIQSTCPTPIVVLTAYNTSALVKQAGQAGVGAYLLKPPNAQDMERAIIIAMARFRDMIELRRLNSQLEKRNLELEMALAKVKLLSGLLPICASCKKIRDDDGYWHQVEVYVQSHSEAEFSHGLCPECVQELYPDLYADVLERKEDIMDILRSMGRVNLDIIAAGVGMPKSNTLNRLRDLVSSGRVNQLTIDDQIYYELP